MKVKISYSEGEKLKALAVAALIANVIPGVKRKDDSKNGKYQHIYLRYAEPKK